MRTIYCPKSHTELAKACHGKEWGHVPGHAYHDVEVMITRRGETFRVHVVESWGSAQERDEEHGRNEVIGRGDSIRAAVEVAHKRATEAGMEAEYLASALSKAEDEAEDAVADEGGA